MDSPLQCLKSIELCIVFCYQWLSVWNLTQVLIKGKPSDITPINRIITIDNSLHISHHNVIVPCERVGSAVTNLLPTFALFFFALPLITCVPLIAYNNNKLPQGWAGKHLTCKEKLQLPRLPCRINEHKSSWWMVVHYCFDAPLTRHHPPVCLKCSIRRGNWWFIWSFAICR